MRQILAALAAATLLAGPATLSAQPADTTAATKKAKTRLSESVLVEGRTARKLVAQIMLDRAGFSPGVIDGYGGGNTESAVRAYQKANDLKVDGVIGPNLIKSLRDGDSGKFMKVVQLRKSDVDRDFEDIPDGMEAQAEMDALGYESVEELIAERYHMDVDFLKALNPDFDWGSASAGDSVLVVRAGPAKLDEAVSRIVVDKSASQVRAYAGETVLATYPATVGSSSLPSPSGKMEVRAVAPEATYHFNPETNNWGGDKTLTLAAGPNNPVGGVWIDLSKDTYGIHGTPDPALIGKTASHGCVRLTNWDAHELADAVETGAVVEFVS